MKTKKVYQQAVATCASLILFSTLAPNTSYGDARVLNYDKNGRIIGSKSFTKDVPKAVTPQSKSRTSPFSRGEPSKFNPDTAVEPGELVLSNPPRGYENKIRSAGFQIIEQVRLRNLGLSIARIKSPDGMSRDDAIRAIGRILPGATVDANILFDPSQGPASGSSPRAKAGWQNLAPNCGQGLTIGQIDSGVDLGHPALQGRDIVYKAFTKPGRQPAAPDHGTSIAGVLVGNPKWGGLMPGAKLYAANMFEINEKGKTVGSAVGLIRAVDWMISQKVDVVNLSIAGGDNRIVRQAFDIAKKNNLLLIAAVGNWGRSDKPAFPAAYDHVIGVTAIKNGGLVYAHANSGNYVDFAEPGVQIYVATPGGGGKEESGTSFAVPYVTVMGAILANAGKVVTAESLRTILKGATTDLGKPGKDNIFGYGLIRARPICK